MSGPDWLWWFGSRQAWSWQVLLCNGCEGTEVDVLQDAWVAADQDEQHPAVGAGIGPALPAPAPGQVQRRAVRHGETAVIDHRLTRACQVERQQPGRVPLALQLEVPAKGPRAERVGRRRDRVLVGLDDLPQELDH